MSLYSIPNICASIILSLLLIFVAVQTRERWNERIVSFLAFCFFTAIWQFTYGVSYNMETEVEALKWLKIGYSGVIFMPVTYLHFVASFLRRGRLKTLIRICYVLSAIFLATLHINRLFLAGTYKYFFGFYPRAFPPVHLCFMLLMTIAVATSIYILYSEWRRHKNQGHAEIERADIHQIELVLIAFLFMAISASDFLPNYGFSYYPIGFFCVVCFSLVIAYSILRYNLHDIQVIVKRTLVFTGLVASVLAVVSLVAFVSQDLLVLAVRIPRWLSNIVSAAIIAVAYGPTRNWLVDVTDQYLFQKKYDYKELLRRFTDEVMIVQNLTQLLDTTTGTLSETIKLDDCRLLLFNKETRKYELATTNRENGQQVTLDEEEPLIKSLRQTGEPIHRYKQLGMAEYDRAINSRLDQLRIQLCLPLQVNSDLIGVLCLGKKRSDEDFTRDDLDILLQLTRTLAISVNNAQLFDELVRVNKQVKATAERLVHQERLAAAGQFAAGMAHEIKNPLAAIKTFTEYLPQKYGDLEFRQKFFRIVQEEIDRISGIVRNLSDFAKPAPLQLEPICPSTLIQDALSLLSDQCLKQRIEVSKAFADQELTVRADPQQLKQVILNLLLNSLEAMPEGGHLDITTQRNHSMLKLKIADSGSGIAPEHELNIWDPFFTTKERGMGLGLAIVKGIIERHDGSIELASTSGKGTVVNILIPLASNEQD